MAANPFSTATATAIGIGDFAFSDDLADAAGLCYAVFPSAMEGSEPILQSARGKRQMALPPINGIDVEQSFDLPETRRLSAIAVRLATYRATDVDGEVVLALRAAGNGVDIARSTLDAGSVADNEMAIFPLAGEPSLPAGRYTVRIRYTPGAHARNLTAWLQQDVPGQVRHGTQFIPGSLQFSVLGSTRGVLEVLARSDGVTAAHNVGCVDGAYWTADLMDPLAARDGGVISLARYAPAHFQLVSQSSTPGFVVVPMQYQPGWVARVDGKVARIRLLYGVMPTVAVPAGRSDITFAYHPPRWRLGLAISCAALLAFVLGWAVRRHRRR
jgi:hypothetical protein